jgi:hypothetical protein
MAPHKPQFIRARPQAFMDRMVCEMLLLFNYIFFPCINESLLFYEFLQIMPAKFVEDYIPIEHLKNNVAKIIGPLNSTCQSNIEVNQLNVFFTGSGWSYFMGLHDITEDNILVVKYEGGLKFWVKVYQPNGFRRQYMDEHNEKEQGELFEIN